jgi:hypothetical protein
MRTVERVLSTEAVACPIEHGSTREQASASPPVGEAYKIFDSSTHAPLLVSQTLLLQSMSATHARQVFVSGSHVGVIAAHWSELVH